MSYCNSSGESVQFCFAGDSFPVGISARNIGIGKALDEIPKALPHPAGTDALLPNQTDGTLNPGGNVDGDDILQMDVIGMPLHQQCHTHILCGQPHNVFGTVTGIDEVWLEACLVTEPGTQVV